MEKRTSNQTVNVSEWTLKFIKCLDAVRFAHNLSSDTAKQYFSIGGNFDQKDYDDCFGDMEERFRKLEKIMSNLVTDSVESELDKQVHESGDPISRL